MPATMDRREAVQRIFRAMFALEEAREVLRETAAKELDESLKGKLEGILDEVCGILKGTMRGHLKYVVDKIELRTREEEFINIDPIQAGGRLTPEARKVLIAYGDGYSVCDYCLAPHRLDHIRRPPIAEFLEELAEFLSMDVARVVRGARDGFRIVTNALLEKGDVVLVSALAHYSLCLAIEAAGGVWREVP
ncbi:MAG: O-phospho-L-seryl-tRNA:Cys-tRNA synthase, partial [Candidatus Alkanophagales archaeon]